MLCQMLLDADELHPVLFEKTKNTLLLHPLDFKYEFIPKETSEEIFFFQN